MHVSESSKLAQYVREIGRGEVCDSCDAVHRMLTASARELLRADHVLVAALRPPRGELANVLICPLGAPGIKAIEMRLPAAIHRWLQKARPPVWVGRSGMFPGTGGVCLAAAISGHGGHQGFLAVAGNVEPEARTQHVLESLARAAETAIVEHSNFRREDRTLSALITESPCAVLRLGLRQPVSLALPEEEAVQTLIRHLYVVEGNAAAAQLYRRYRTADLAGAPMIELLPPERLEAVVRSYIRGCPRSDSEEEVNGRTYRITRITVIEGSHVTGGWEIATDVSDLREISAQVEALNQTIYQQNEKLVEREIRLNALVAHNPEAILCLATDPPIPDDMPVEEALEQFYAHAFVSDCNDHAARLYGRGSAAELRGTLFAKLAPRSEDQLRRLRTAIAGRYTVSEDEWLLNGRSYRAVRIPTFRNRKFVEVWIALRDITDLKRARREAEDLNGELATHLSELKDLRRRLESENAQLGLQRSVTHDAASLIGNSPRFRALMESIRRIARSDATVLIQGETGSGKELVARAIHHLSARRDQPLLKIDCAAIPPSLVESELFGHMRGSFTGATEKRAGRFAQADRGTVLLDEIGELSLDAQARLLRVLQDHEFEPVGSDRTLKIDIRVLAATNRDLCAAVREGLFRADLYYRLNVVPLQVPPLRERREDIAQLAEYFLHRLGPRAGYADARFSPQLLAQMEAYDWPGNVRELENFVARSLVLATGPEIDAPAPHAGGFVKPSLLGATLEDAQRRCIEEALRNCGGVIEGPRGAAQMLGMNPSTLRSRMKRLGLVWR
jgi:DNA-binding NtrC family response regulator